MSFIILKKSNEQHHVKDKALKALSSKLIAPKTANKSHLIALTVLPFLYLVSPLANASISSFLPIDESTHELSNEASLEASSAYLLADNAPNATAATELVNSSSASALQASDTDINAQTKPHPIDHDSTTMLATAAPAPATKQGKAKGDSEHVAIADSLGYQDKVQAKVQSKAQVQSGTDAVQGKESFDEDLAKLSKKHCPLNKEWKIAVVESGSDFPNYQSIFRHMVIDLMGHKLMSESNLLVDPYFKFDEGRNFDKLYQDTKDGCLSFYPKLYDENWNRTNVLAHKEEIKKEIAEGKIDMIWAFGTIAGLYFADPNLNVPVLVINATDPESSGLSDGNEFSLKKNIHVENDRSRYFDEMDMFYNIFTFKRLGILVDGNHDNQAVQAIYQIRRYAEQKGITLVPCYGDILGNSQERADKDFKSCLTELSNKDIDALFLSVGYRPKEPLYGYLKPFIDKGIPIYSQMGENDVRQGAVMCLSESDMLHSALFESRVVRQIVNGTAPEFISQYVTVPLTLTVNWQTARLIEWQPSFEVLVAIDKVYHSIDK